MRMGTLFVYILFVVAPRATGFTARTKLRLQGFWRSSSSAYHHQRPTGRHTSHQPQPQAVSTSATEGDDSSGSQPLLANAYLLGGIASGAAWGACAHQALATYKPWRVRHNSIGVAQALTALPLLWGVTRALATTARGGGRLLAVENSQRARCYRQLNLGLAAASLWSAACVVWAPRFTAALVRTADPVTYAQPLVIAAAAAHLGTALVCLEAWRRSVRCPPLGAWRASRRVAAGLCDSIWRLAPAPSSSSSALAALLPLPLGGRAGTASSICLLPRPTRSSRFTDGHLRSR